MGGAQLCANVSFHFLNAFSNPSSGVPNSTRQSKSSIGFLSTFLKDDVTTDYASFTNKTQFSANQSSRNISTIMIVLMLFDVFNLDVFNPLT